MDLCPPVAILPRAELHLHPCPKKRNHLFVPVIKDVDKKGVLQIADEMSRLATSAREGKLKPGDMQGGCFSVSSLGGIGGTSFTPIINAP
jgi:pyruvate dehydrogenase E2 component (dihydrolipoamide acetyltransferase)